MTGNFNMVLMERLLWITWVLWKTKHLVKHAHLIHLLLQHRNHVYITGTEKAVCCSASLISMLFWLSTFSVSVSWYYNTHYLVCLCSPVYASHAHTRICMHAHTHIHEHTHMNTHTHIYTPHKYTHIVQGFWLSAVQHDTLKSQLVHQHDAP